MDRTTMTGFRRTVLGVCLAALPVIAACDDSSNPVAPDPVEEVPFQIVELVVGDGPAATEGDLLTMSFDAWLYNAEAPDFKGQKIDFGDNVAFILGASGVIDGWNEGFLGMQAGGLRRLIVPPSKAYGATGSGRYPPNATIVFEVELHELEDLSTPDVAFSVVDLEVGDGAEAITGRTVIIAYEGYLYSDTEPENKGLLVEASRANAFVLGAGEVIEAFDQGVPGMRVGGRRRIITPASLAHGDVQVGPIPPNSSLVYDVTLLVAVD